MRLRLQKRPRRTFSRIGMTEAGMLPAVVAAEHCYIGDIPVKNIWLLMLYASDLLRLPEAAHLASWENMPDDLPALLARILADVVELRQRRQLSRGYRAARADLSRVRGRIDVFRTERRQLLARGLIACKFDELTFDTPRNRYVRSALESIAPLVQHSHAELAHRCRKLASDFRELGVTGRRPPDRQILSMRYGLHDADDRYMVAVAQLALEFALPTEEAGRHSLPWLERDKQSFPKLFEKAVGGFYKFSYKSWTVQTGLNQHWQKGARTAGIDSLLPKMKTDIVLESPDGQRRIVVDTKFTSMLTKPSDRHGAKVKTGNLYQIYAYLRSQEGRPGDILASSASGVLLYPSTGVDFDEAVCIQGHAIRFATVNLAASAADVRRDLKRIVDTDPLSAAAAESPGRISQLN